MTKRLPPYAKPIAEARRNGLVPVTQTGWVIVSLNWDIAPNAVRVVIPPGTKASDFDLACLAGLDLLILYRASDEPRLDSVAQELIELPPRTLTACPLDGGRWTFWHAKGETLMGEPHAA